MRSRARLALTTLAMFRMTFFGMRHAAPLRRLGALGVVVVLLAACGVAAGQGPWATSTPVTATPSSTPDLVAMLPGTPSPWSTVPASIAPEDARAPAPPPIVSRQPSTTPARGLLLVPPARPGPFAVDLYRPGDFVSQARSDWCVPAAILSMANLIDRHASSSLPSQDVLDRRSRALSSPRLVGRGSEPQGWAAVLNRLGYGPYVVVARATFREATTTAAWALRLTGRPVGLLVWRGSHAWVMSGFESTADPAWSSNFKVTRVRIIDLWYPRRLSAWGRTRAPDARLSLAALARNLVPWHRPTVRYRELDGRFVLVLPVAGAVGG